MATGSNVASTIDTMYPGLGLGDAQELAAINAALRNAWPAIKVLTRTADAGTFDDGTFDYSLSAVTDLTEFGVAQVFVNDADGDVPDLPLSLWSQYRDSSGYWHVVFPEATADAYDGNTFDVAYERKPADLAGLSETLEAPQAYVEPYALWWLAVRGIFAQATVDSRKYEAMIAVWEKEWREALRRNMVLPLPRTHRTGLLRGPVSPG